MVKIPDLKREKQTIEVWNRCECGELLFSILEGKRGTCAGCWMKAMPAETKSALNKLIGAAFRKTPPTETEKDQLIKDAFSKLKQGETPEST